MDIRTGHFGAHEPILNYCKNHNNLPELLKRKSLPEGFITRNSYLEP